MVIIYLGGRHVYLFEWKDVVVAGPVESHTVLHVTKTPISDAFNSIALSNNLVSKIYDFGSTRTIYLLIVLVANLIFTYNLRYLKQKQHRVQV